MQAVSVYLTFKGNAEEAFNFYQQALGGNLETHRFKDMPEGDKLPEADQNKVMHTSLTLPNGQIIMASDTIESIPECRSQELVAGNNFTISITPENEAEADKLFAALSAGGTISMPLQKTFWNAYFGMLTDKFGIQWMVNYEYPQS